jgi:hypothetical protein
MENTVTPENRPNQKNAILMALANVLIFGSPYLALHRYERFFIAFLFFILSLFWFPPATLVVAVTVIIDTYLVALKQDKEGIKKSKNTILNILGVITIIAFTALYTTINNFPWKFAWSPDSCKQLYLFNDKAQLLCYTNLKWQQRYSLKNIVPLPEGNDTCKLLDTADATKITGLPISKNEPYGTSCVYKDEKITYFTITPLYEDSLEYEKQIRQGSTKDSIKPHDEIQKGSFLKITKYNGVTISDFYLISNNKVHEITGYFDKEKNPYLSEQTYLNLAKAILEKS